MNSRGFTLIEFIIVTSIVLLVSGGVLANYNSYNETQRLKQAAVTLKSHLRLAQTKAITGNKPKLNCPTFVGYRVLFPSSSTYSTVPVCSNGVSATDNATYALPTGVTFSVIPPSFDFQVITGAVTVATNITFTSLARTYELQISSSGDITDNGLQ